MIQILVGWVELRETHQTFEIYNNNGGFSFADFVSLSLTLHEISFSFVGKSL